MVKSLNLGLKVKVLGPLLPIRGVGGHRYMISYNGWGYCGWVGGPASFQAWSGGWVGPRAGKRAQLAPRREASAPRSGAQPTLEEYQSSNVIYSFGKCLANQSQPCCTVL